MRRINSRVLMLVFVVLFLCVGYVKIAVPNCLVYRAGCLGYPTATPAPTPSPGRYRILWPTLESIIAPTIPQNEPGILYIDALLHFACLAITIPALYSWLKQWADADRALGGVFVFAALNFLAFSWYFRGGGVVVEVMLVCVGLAVIKRSWLYFVPLVVIGAFNRETSLILVGIYAAYHWRSRWREVVALFGIWVGITAGLHVALGYAPHQVNGIAGTWLFNLSTIFDAAFSNIIYLPIIALVALSYRAAPMPLKRLIWVTCGYLVVVVLMGAWGESNRLSLPLIPLVIPMLLRPNLSESKPVATRTSIFPVDRAA